MSDEGYVVDGPGFLSVHRPQAVTECEVVGCHERNEVRALITFGTAALHVRFCAHHGTEALQETYSGRLVQSLDDAKATSHKAGSDSHRA